MNYDNSISAMKTRKLAVLLTATAMLLIVSCENQKEITETGITGKLTNSSECKSLKSGNLKSDIPDSLSCIDYSYDTANHKLTMKHINAGFNCCPGKLSCTVSAINDTIFIRESEKQQGCDCDCLFDLDIELQGVDQNKYQVRFIEPYADGQEELNFEMDLILNNEGAFCVVRKGYPWGV
jgi:hypothetical protein